MTILVELMCRARRHIQLAVTVVGAALLFGCDTTPREAVHKPTESKSTTTVSESPATAIAFEDVTQQVGLHFVPANGRDRGHYTILESLGTGVGIVDIDGDRNLDVVTPGGGTFDDDAAPTGVETGVFRQTGSMHFNDISAVCGIETSDRYTHGVATGDWNNDGFPDVVITGFRTARLFLNCGDGTFQDVTEQASIPQTSWSTSAAFLDADSDGDLELYIVNYVDWHADPDRRCLVGGHRDICPPARFDAQSDWLFDNNGNGTFRETSKPAGLEDGGKGLAVIAADIDIDGDTDLYVANDTTANFYYINDGAGHFAEEALVSGCALGATMEAEGSMGVAVEDFNLDGMPDVWVANYENQSFAMYQSQAAGIFQHVSAMTGISAVGNLYVGFGTAGLDADLDGDMDIFAANGHVMYESKSAPVRQLPLVYENLNGQRFRNVAEKIGEYGRSLHMGRGLATGDLNHDGRWDIVVAHTNEHVSILQNTSRTQAKWYGVELIGRDSNRDSIGARVKLSGRIGQINSGGSYLSASQKSIFFAAATSQQSVEIEVFWPSGQTQTETIRENSVRYIIEPISNSRKLP